MALEDHKQIVLDDIAEYSVADRGNPVTVFELLALPLRAQRLGITDQRMDEINSWIGRNPELVSETLARIDLEEPINALEDILHDEEPNPTQLLDVLFDADLLLCVLGRAGFSESADYLIDEMSRMIRLFSEDFIPIKKQASLFVEWNGGPNAGGGNPLWVLVSEATLPDPDESIGWEEESELPPWLHEMIERESKKGPRP